MIRAIGKRLLGAKGASPDEGPAGACSAREGELERIAARMSAIGSMILADAPSRDIFDAMARGFVEDSGADFIIVRIAKPGGDVFEMKASAGFGDIPVEPRYALSVSRTNFSQSLRRRRTGCQADSSSGPEAHWRSPTARCRAAWIRLTGRSFLPALKKTGPSRDFSPSDSSTAPPTGVSRPDRSVPGPRASGPAARTRKKQLRDKERSLAICREELDGVNQLKSNFLSVVSHELRTPLTSVKAYTETLLDNVDTIKRETLQDFSAQWTRRASGSSSSSTIF